VTSSELRIPAPTRCPKCGTALAAGLYRCPACQALVYADVLTELARRADAAAAEGDLATATQRWHEALALLPPDAGQRATIDSKLEALGARMERGEGKRTTAPRGPKRGMWAALVAGAAFLAAKGKLLLLGLTKAGALLSLFAFLGIYWREWGWALAAGIVVSLYLHELGHVAALKRYRIPVSAPMFVPGFGAYVRHGALPTARIGARVALAGPAAGLCAAALALAMGALTGNAYWAAIAHLGAILNLGNLMPIWVLDGVRAVAPLDLPGRIIFVAALVVVALVTRDPVAAIVALVTGGALAFGGRGGTGDRGALLYGVGVIAGLGVVLALAK
jgi:Zn-dependent protease